MTSNRYQIRWLKNIVILRMNEATHLDQSFFDLLPDHHPRLRWIHIDNRELTNLNLNFLFKLGHLYKVEFKNSVIGRGLFRLQETVRKGRKEKIAQINGDLLFEIDELKLEFAEYLAGRKMSRPN